jgi:hypothetical protein
MGMGGSHHLSISGSSRSPADGCGNNLTFLAPIVVILNEAGR